MYNNINSKYEETKSYVMRMVLRRYIKATSCSL